MPKRAPKRSSAPPAAAGRIDRMLGAHLAVGGGLVKAADRAAAVGATGLQIFTGNPTGWTRRAELPKELPAFRARMKEHGFGPLAVHAAYLANLAGPNPVFREKTVELLRAARANGVPVIYVHGMGDDQLKQVGRWGARITQAKRERRDTGLTPAELSQWDAVQAPDPSAQFASVLSRFIHPAD